MREALALRVLPRADGRGRGGVAMWALARREPSWIALTGAQATLFVWCALLTLRDADPSTRLLAPLAAASATGAAVLGVFGFLVPAVFGMFPRLAPGLLGLPRPTWPAAAVPACIGGSMSALALTWAFCGESEILPALGALAAVGALAVIATIGSLARARSSLPLVASPPFARVALPGNLLLFAGMLYLVLGSVLFAISTEPSLSLATGIAPMLGSPLHLLTAGFLVLTAFGVGLRMFAAFSAAEPPPAAAWVLVVFGVPAPAGIAIGISYTSNALLAVSAASALAAAATFLVVILHYWRRQRRRRAAWWLLVAAAAMLVAGEALGGLFAFDPRLRVNLIAVHAQVNVIGFGGLLIFGVLFALSGGRAARPGTIPPGISIAVVWPAALGLRLVGAALGLSALAAAGAIAILATLVLAARDARPPGTRVPPGQAAA